MSPKERRRPGQRAAPPDTHVNENSNDVNIADPALIPG